MNQLIEPIQILYCALAYTYLICQGMSTTEIESKRPTHIDLLFLSKIFCDIVVEIYAM